MFLEIQTSTAFWEVPRLCLPVLLVRKHVEDDEYGALVEWYGQGKTEVLGEKAARLPLRPPKMSLRLTQDQNPGLDSDRTLTNHLSHGTAAESYIYQNYISRSSLYCKINTLCLYYQTSQLMLYREIIAVCSEIHTKHINILCGQNVELLNVKLVVHIVTTGL